MVSKAKEDFPLPDSPVNTTNLFLGISRSIFLRLFSLAPLMIILSINFSYLRSSIIALNLRTNNSCPYKMMYANFMSWVVYALLGAFFAALTAILAKIGIKSVDSNLATAIRTVVIIIFAWSIVFFQGTFNQISSISKFSLLYLILSGITTGLSWLFYFRALQLGQASQVSPIDKLSLVITIILAVVILREKVSASIVIGAILMSLGAILVGFGK